MSTISTSGIAPSSVIRAEHVLRVINALSNNANNDILISGSLIVTGSTALSGSLNVIGGITGSFFGTSSNATSASYAVNASSAASASYALTASYVLGGGTSINTGSFATTGSNTFNGNQTINGLLNISGSIIPSVSKSFSLGSTEFPFKDIFISSGSLNIASDTPGEPNTILSNVDGNILISAGGMQLLGTGSFNASTGSFQYISGSMTQVGNYTQLGNHQTTGSVSISGSGFLNGYSILTSALPINYGLFNQTGSSSPISGSTHISGSLIDGGIGTLTVPANEFNLGDAYKVILSGKLTAENNKTLEIRVKAQDVILTTTGVITMPSITDKNWKMEIDFSVNSIGGEGIANLSSSGFVMFRSNSGGVVITEIFSDINNTTFDTTISNTLTIEAIWGGGATDADSIYSILCTLNKTY